MKIGHDIQFAYKLALESAEKSKVMLWASTPLDNDGQTIKSFFPSIKPLNVYDAPSGNKISFYNFAFERKYEVSFSLCGRFYGYENERVQANLPIFAPNDSYLKSNKYIEQPDWLKETVKKMIGDTRGAVERICLIADYLEERFKYVEPVLKRGVLNLSPDKLEGDCGEVGALFVSMCRIAGVPAVNETGFVVYCDEPQKAYEHGWASVFVGNRWFNIDPLARNLERTDSGFVYNQKNILMSFSKGFDLPLSPKIPDEYSIDFWIKQGLPMSRDRVQVMQPMVFVSDKAISSRTDWNVKNEPER